MPSFLAEVQAEFAARTKTAAVPQVSNPPTDWRGEYAYADARYALFPKGYLTPYNPSRLVSVKGISVYDEMRLDDQVKAALSFKKMAALSTMGKVVSPEGYPEDWEPTVYVKKTLDDLEGTFSDDLFEILTALDFGFSVTEKVYEQEKPGGPITLSALKTKRPHEFRFYQDAFGNLFPDGLKQLQLKGLQTMPRDKFVLFANDMEFSNWYGRSDLEAAYKPWWSKQNAYKFAIILLERLGIPPVIGKYDPGRYSAQQTAQLQKAIENIQAMTFGVIPVPGVGTPAQALEFWTPELAGQAVRVFQPMLDMYNRDIARAILMPGHLGLTADAHQGSYARAQVNFDIFMLAIEKLRLDLQTRVINEQIIRPLVDMNFAGVDVYPVWEFLPISEEIRLDILDRWEAAVEKGSVTPQVSDEEHIRELLRFPKKETEAPPPAAEVTAPGVGGDLPQIGAQPNQTGFQPKSKGGLPGGRPPTAYAQFTLTRQPNRYERYVSFTLIDNNLDNLQQGARDQMVVALTDSRDRMISYVERNISKGPSVVDGLRMPGASDVQTICRGLLQKAYDSGETTVRAEVPKTFQRGPTFVPTDALKWLARKAAIIGTDISGTLLDKTKNIIMNAIKIGETQRETTDKLKKAWEAYLGDQGLLKDGAAVDGFRLDTILRTAVTEAFNQGRLVMVRDPSISRFVRGMIYSAVIDSRTTEVCRYLDGKIFAMGEPEMDRMAPPNHYNCRSILVPVTVGMIVDEADFITPAELGHAEMLVQVGFK